MIDFEKSFASSPKAEFWSDVNEKKPCEVSKSCNKKFWFTCDECEHSFETRLGNVTNNNIWCPYCANQKLCEEDCTHCHEKSFASSPRTESWDYVKNVENPRGVYKSSHTKFWFNCGECKHSFETSLGHVTNNGRWCPYCAKPPKRLCEEDCTQCHEKSFASSPTAVFWSDVNEKTPREVFKSSHTKFWFICGECEHSFDTRLGSVTTGNWCPFCANQKMCEEDCTHYHEKSFTNSPRAVSWDYVKNKKKPREVFKSSNTKFWFNCDTCEHSFETSLGDVTNNGRWCPMCVNKTEKMFLRWFESKYKHLVIKHQAKYVWCKDKRRLPFDFSIESLKLIIEIDGPQHYRQVSNWQAPEITQARDEYKTQKALENGYTVIRISQEDIFKNIKGWEDELVKILN